MNYFFKLIFMCSMSGCVLILFFKGKKTTKSEMWNSLLLIFEIINLFFSLKIANMMKIFNCEFNISACSSIRLMCVHFL